LGFAFQIVDDILDGDGYLRFMSAHEAKEKAAEVISDAKKELEGFKRNQPLLEIADLILNRTQNQ
jgi:geranylgeranyl pyrophosphate synthase